MQRREDLEKLIEQIDACRAGSDDVHAPDLEALRPLERQLEHDAQARELYDSLQGFDERIGAAVREVRLVDFPQTAGLEERLLAAVSQAAAAQAAVSQADWAGDESDIPAATEPETSERPTVQRSSRRRAMLWGLAGLATTAACVGIVVGLMEKAEPVFEWTASLVHDEALVFYSADKEIRKGVSIDRTSPPESHPLGSQVRQFEGITWRNVNGFLDTEQAVAYDIPAEGGNPVATLYVVRLSVPELPQWPESDPDHGTGGVLLSAWQTGDLVYVLVVRGNKDAYQHFVKKLYPEFA
ncbi:MAG: hypothetical protein IIA67_11710 [Planctomycetes bacterium]|nr:hypothetical protein [Planctomycetota bacterium]